MRLFRKFVLVVLLTLVANVAAAQFNTPNRSAQVNAANVTAPQYLRANTNEDAAKFTYCAAKTITSEEWGLLSKSPDETGHTWGNGVRTSHDVIALRSPFRQVDIIGGAGSGTPTLPTWNVIDPAFYRPSNSFVPLSAIPAVDCTGSISPPPIVKTRLGASLFWAIRGMRDYRLQLDTNLAFIKNDLGADYVRVFMVLGGDLFSGVDPWRDASVDHRSPGFEQLMISTTDHIFDTYGLKVHWVLIGGRAHVPNQVSQEAAARLWLHAHLARLNKVELVEVWNEYTVNNGTASDVRNIARILRVALPTGFPIALSSPTSTHSPTSTKEEVWAETDQLYGGDSGASVFTYHSSRPEPVWGPGSDFGAAVRGLPKRNSEPRGPGASAGGAFDDPAIMAGDYAASIAVEEAGYVFHTKAGVWGGHCFGFPDQNTHANIFDHPNVTETARRLKALRGGLVIDPGPVDPPPGQQPYPDENTWWRAFKQEIRNIYSRAGVPLDDFYPIWFARTSYDVASGMDKDAAADKHFRELKAILGVQ